MKLKQIVCDMTDLTLTKEKKVIKYGEVFEVDESRVEQVLAARFRGQPVAELLEEPKEEVKEIKKDTKQASKKK